MEDEIAEKLVEKIEGLENAIDSLNESIKEISSRLRDLYEWQPVLKSMPD